MWLLIRAYDYCHSIKHLLADDATFISQDLIEDLESELTGNFEEMIMAMLKPTAFYDAWSLHKAIGVSIWPASCKKGPWDICKKCSPRPAAASQTPRLVRVYTV